MGNITRQPVWAVYGRAPNLSQFRKLTTDESLPATLFSADGIAKNGANAELIIAVEDGVAQKLTFPVHQADALAIDLLRNSDC